MQTANPLISVIIPTRNRPKLLLRAIRSVLAQTYQQFEIVVVIDGPDESTLAALAELKDSRIHPVPLTKSVGGAEARNVGARKACGEWIALLDDDDEWFSTKLQAQLELGQKSNYACPVISSKLIARSPLADYEWPRGKPSLPIGDYLLGRRSLFQGEGLLQTSTLMVPKRLFERVAFNPELRKQQDWDWLIRAFQIPGVGLEFIPHPLAVWYIEEARPSITAASDWRYTLQWVDSVRDLISRDTYASFLLICLGALASNTRDWSACPQLLARAWSFGDIRFRYLVIYAGIWLFPASQRRWLRSKIGGAVTRNLG